MAVLGRVYDLGLGDSRSGEDYISREQGSPLAQEGDSLLDAKDHIGGVALLHQLPVQLGRDLQGLRVLDEVASNNSRAIWAPAVEALTDGPLAAAALELPVAVRDVITHSVPEDVVQRLRLWDIGTPLSDDDDQFALVVQPGALLRKWMDWYGVMGPGETR